MPMPRSHRSRSCGDAKPFPSQLSGSWCAARRAVVPPGSHHAARERTHPHLSPALSATHSFPSIAGRSLRELGFRALRRSGGREGERAAPLVFPLRLWGRGTGGGGLVVCATLSRSRSRIRVTQRQIFQTAAGRIASVCHQDRGLRFRCLYQGIPLIPLNPTLSRQIPPKNCAGRGRNERCADRNSEGRSD